MLAVASNRTKLHFFERHYCITHGKIVDKRHIDECQHLEQGKFKPTHFNRLLEETTVHLIQKEVKLEMVEHFKKLHERIQMLESNQVFVVIDKRMAPQQ